MNSLKEQKLFLNAFWTFKFSDKTKAVFNGLLEVWTFQHSLTVFWWFLYLIFHDTTQITTKIHQINHEKSVSFLFIPHFPPSLTPSALLFISRLLLNSSSKLRQKPDFSLFSLSLVFLFQQFPFQFQFHPGKANQSANENNSCFFSSRSLQNKLVFWWRILSLVWI